MRKLSFFGFVVALALVFVPVAQAEEANTAGTAVTTGDAGTSVTVPAANVNVSAGGTVNVQAPPSGGGSDVSAGGPPPRPIMPPPSGDRPGMPPGGDRPMPPPPGDRPGMQQGGDDHSFADRARQIEQETRERMTREQMEREKQRRMEEGNRQNGNFSGERPRGEDMGKGRGDNMGPRDMGDRGRDMGPRDREDRGRDMGPRGDMPRGGEGEFHDEGGRGKGRPFGGGPGMMPGGDCLPRVKNTLKRVQKKVSVPSEWLQVITDVEAVSAKMKAASGDEETDFEEMMDSVEDKAENLCMLEPKLMGLEQMNRMATRDAARELKRLQTQYAKSKKLAAKSGEDISGITAKLDAEIAGITASVEMLKKGEPQGESELAKALADFRKLESDPSDMQDVMEIVRETVFERFGDVYDQFRLLERIGQSAKGIAQAEKEIAKYAATADKLEKPNKKGQKKDVSELRKLISEMRELLAEAKQMMKDGAEEEDMFEIQARAEELMNDADEEIAHLGGKKTSVDNAINGTSPVVSAGANLWASIRNWLEL